MFCPSCGFEYTQKTNYCKRCGEDLAPAGSADAPKRRQPGLIGMFWGILLFCLTTMGVLLAAYERFRDMARCNGLCGDDRTLLAFVGIFSFVVAVLLIWQLARMVTAFRRTGQNVIVEKHFIREVPTSQLGAPTGQIPEAGNSPSVVEHTTRQMAGAYRETEAMK